MNVVTCAQGSMHAFTTGNLVRVVALTMTFALVAAYGVPYRVGHSFIHLLWPLYASRLYLKQFGLGSGQRNWQ